MSNDQTGEKQDDKKKALGWGQQETVYMSNNINPFTVMPLAPNQVSGGQLTPNILVDTIGAYTTGGTIQLLSDLNAEFPAELKYNGQTIYPYEVYNPSRTSIANCGTSNANGTFTVSLNGYPQLSMTNGDTIFKYADPRNYKVVIDGFLTTSNSVGIGQAATTSHALSVSGDVLITGKVNLAGVQLANLGIATAVAPGFVFDVSGDSILRGTTTLTKNTFIQGFLGLGKTSATVALDVSGSSTISNNITIGGNTFTNRLGVGKFTNLITGYALDVSGDSYIAGKLAISSNLDISKNMVVTGSTRMIGQGVGVTLDVSGNINYSTNLSGKSATLTSNVSVLGSVGIGRTDVPNYKLQVWGNTSVTGNLEISEGNINAATINTSIITANTNNSRIVVGGTGSFIVTPYLAINRGWPTSDDYKLQLIGAAQFGTSTQKGQIALNIDFPTYDFDMSGTFNTTQSITSNAYVKNIYGQWNNPITGDTSGINTYGTIYNNTQINTPKLNINTLLPINPLSITGTSDFFGDVNVMGNTNVTGTLNVIGNIIQTAGSGYVLAPTNITVIQYNPAGATGGTSNLPGYWNLSSTTVTLILDTWPMIYVLDGSSSNTNMTLQIQTNPEIRTGVNYSFVARRTSGAGHTIQYPYSSGLTYSKTLASPLSFPLVCIGSNDYSST